MNPRKYLLRIKYIISGTTRGLGKFTADYIKCQGREVLGINRRNPQSDVHNLIMDLSDANCVVKNLNRLESFIDSNSIVVFISNAAVIEPINVMGKLCHQDIIRAINVNLISPVLISNHIIGLCNKAIIFNITSGAAKSINKGLGVYSATKAGFDKMCDISIEELEKQKVYIESFDPGTIDTDMQRQLRESKHFERAAVFKDLKDQGRLRSAQQVSIEIFNRIEQIISDNGWDNESHN